MLAGSPVLRVLFPFQRLPPYVVKDHGLVRLWLREVILLWGRWSATSLLPVLLLLFSTRLSPLGVALLIVLLISNGVLTWLLFSPCHLVHLRRIRHFATGIDCSVAIGFMAVFSADLASPGAAFGASCAARVVNPLSASGCRTWIRGGDATLGRLGRNAPTTIRCVAPCDGGDVADWLDGRHRLVCDASRLDHSGRTSSARSGVASSPGGTQRLPTADMWPVAT